MARASAAAALLEDVVKRAVLPDLKQRGFRRSGSTFRRSLTGCVHVVNVQAGRRFLEGKFTLNVGVFFPAAHDQVRELLRWDPGPGGPSEHECTVRRRIGELLNVEDHWWTLSPGDCDRVVDEVRLAVRDVVLPWLERCSDGAVARQEASGPQAIALALMLGDVEDARRRARQEISDAPQATALHAWLRARGLVG
jgi:hypothetical protein